VNARSPQGREFVNRSQIPMLTMNLLQALPKTAPWDRWREMDAW
jgi:hypothetical protein